MRKIDPVLLPIHTELDTLTIHSELIEEQVVQARTRAQEALDANIVEMKQFPEHYDESSWDLARLEYRSLVEVTYPRILRNPFLVSLFSLYESAVQQIAERIQEEEGVEKPMSKDGGFLRNARRYYEEILDFKLSKSCEHWRRLVLLSDLRNAIAHTNGNVETIRPEKLVHLLKQPGIHEEGGFIVVSKVFMKQTVKLVGEDLADLLARREARL